jgi:cation-transporting P-type ATPase D
MEILDSRAKVPKTRELYGNCAVYSPDKQLMFRCHKKRIDWYLSRNLATIIDSDPVSIQLTFEPKGFSSKDYLLEPKRNCCVSCGTEDYLTRHHIIPRCYFTHFPEKIKSRNSKYIVALCEKCHRDYENKADTLKSALALAYDAPFMDISIITVHEPGIEAADVYTTPFLFKKLLTLSCALVKQNTIPEKRRHEIYQSACKIVGRELSEEEILKISKMRLDSISKYHGEKVMKEAIEDLETFAFQWIDHFLDNCSTKFMSDKLKENLYILEEK